MRTASAFLVGVTASHSFCSALSCDCLILFRKIASSIHNIYPRDRYNPKYTPPKEYSSKQPWSTPSSKSIAIYPVYDDVHDGALLSMEKLISDRVPSRENPSVEHKIRVTSSRLSRESTSNWCQKNCLTLLLGRSGRSVVMRSEPGKGLFR
jgi:hypothetical protein